MLLLLLLLIPVFCMGVSVYIATLYQYVVDKFYIEAVIDFLAFILKCQNKMIKI